jgi:hypothetical protein
VLQSTSAGDLGGHHGLILGSHEDADDHVAHDDAASATTHSRRSSLDAGGGLIIHESLPGSRHASPAVSRRTSIDHGSLLHHLNDRRGSLEQSLIGGSGLCLIPENHVSVAGLSDLAGHHHPFLGRHDAPSEGCRLPGSDPPTPANGLRSLCTMLDSDAMSRQYHSMPNSPRPQGLPSVSALASLESCVQKAAAGSGIMEQVTYFTKLTFPPKTFRTVLILK